jgi:anti-sigma28 factor (negative regulator of flagellin synthesis)
MLEINPSSARPELPSDQIRDTPCVRGDHPQKAPTGRMRGQDRVELSASVQEQEAAVQAATGGRLAELRTRIADGTYLTPDKIDYVIDRLREELTGRSDAA